MANQRFLKQSLFNGISLLGATSLAQALVTLPVGVYLDAKWEHNPGLTGVSGGHAVEASAYDFENEQWEQSVEGQKWSQQTSGGVDYLISNSSDGVGKYYAYGDLTQVELTETANTWEIVFTVAGDRDWVGDKSSPEGASGLKAKYWVYFGNSTAHYAFLVDSPGDKSGNVDVSLLSAPGSQAPYGSAITNTGEKDDNGYQNEDSSPTGLSAFSYYNEGSGYQSATSNYDLGITYDFTAGGVITKSFLENLDYFYVGTAVSNPSGIGDVFANDEASAAFGTGISIEFDTLRIGNPQDPLDNDNYEGPNNDGQGPQVPEPATTALVLGIAAVGIGFLKRLRK